MLTEMPIAEAGDALETLPERLAEAPRAIAVTRRGTPVLAVLPWELYESIVETLAILEDREFAATLRQGIREAEEGRGVPWQEARKTLAP